MAERTRILRGLTDDELEALEWDWRFWARPEQVAPEGEWQQWLYLGGRGAGKTRAGAEWIRERIKSGERRVALVAPTVADARDVMVEGESGLLSVCWEHDRTDAGAALGKPQYEPSKRRLTWGNGAQAVMFSAEEPERLRGPQHGAAWADELAAWSHCRQTWDMLMFGLRLGERPQVCITTTPRPVSTLRDIMGDPLTVRTHGSTFANAANLAPSYIRNIRKQYEGTRLGQQELYAEFLEEAEGALWSREMLEAARWRKSLPEMKRVVVGVDPAITMTEDSAETGIVVAGLGEDDIGYVIADVSGRFSPGDWAKKAIGAFQKYAADRIVAEGNQGGEMVRHTLQTEWRGAPVRIVNARRGKQARAEPVSALYEQGRVRHWGQLAELEDQMVTWEPLSGMPSPDRLDALVWALTDLMVGQVAHDFWIV